MGRIYAIIGSVAIASLVTYTIAVGTGAQCTKTPECKETNYHSHCYNWLTADSCPKGACRCDKGYGGNTCVLQPTIQGHGEICNSSLVCDRELHCNGTTGRCSCATSTYVHKDVINFCVDVDDKVVNESCTETEECYNWGGAQGGIECVGSPTKTCQCKTGYAEIGGLCQIPTHGQSCNDDVGCVPMYHPDIPVDDESRVAEQCINGVCICPSGSDLVPLNVDGTFLTYCLRSPTGPQTPMKYLGQTCSTSSECISKVCISCPGSTETSRKCVAPLLGKAPRGIRSANSGLTAAMVAIWIYAMLKLY